VNFSPPPSAWITKSLSTFAASICKMGKYASVHATCHSTAVSCSIAEYSTIFVLERTGFMPGTRCISVMHAGDRPLLFETAVLGRDLDLDAVGVDRTLIQPNVEDGEGKS
jgi:hypothetical protein